MAKDIELLQEDFYLGEHGSTFAKQAAVSAAGCLTVSCLFELVLFSKKDVRGVRTRGIHVLYSILHSHCQIPLISPTCCFAQKCMKLIMNQVKIT